MAFQLKREEPVRAGLLRVTARELVKAQAELRSTGREDDAIHEVRKSLKRTRAVLRLVRDELGDEAYRRENLAFRDAARPLAEVRDATVLIETLDALVVSAPTFTKVREALLRNRQSVGERALADGRAVDAVAKALGVSLARLPAWAIHEGWPALGSGLERVYRAGRRALAAASREPSVKKLHEWRKQTKYLWHALQLIEPAWSASERGLGELAHQQTVLLGEDHDLAVLRRLVRAAPRTYGGQRVVRKLVTVIDGRRLELQDLAFTLGRQLYVDSPRVFTKRIGAYWKTWRAGVRPSQKDGPEALSRVRSGG
jgi:CHAD domain-containing protein